MTKYFASGIESGGAPLIQHFSISIQEFSVYLVSKSPELEDLGGQAISKELLHMGNLKTLNT